MCSECENRKCVITLCRVATLLWLAPAGDSLLTQFSPPSSPPRARHCSCAAGSFREGACDATTGKGFTCSPCQANSYSIGDNEDESCTLQPFCGQGEYISPVTFTSRRVCAECPGGGDTHYQVVAIHREVQCLDQTECGLAEWIR